ncbi:MAG: dihydroorotate dehydrogenase electron transfer subunit [Candidatus Saelkia tenebricola]|nr:dihydroorotate dehydrogenase electron transfer subunit [Candidatus Saelkia tenebricola]
MKKDFTNVQVLFNNEIYPYHYLIGLKTPNQVCSYPGQFLQLRLLDKNQFLRKPFSIFDQESNVLKILYKIRGHVTKELSTLKEGDSLDIIYPLGQGFPASGARKVLLVSGGTGFAPLHFLAKRYADSSGVEVKFLIGSSGAEVLEFEKLLKPLGVKAIIATEDGSVGKKGVVTNLFKDISDIKEYIICSTGPVEMLKEIYSFAHSKGIKTYFSLESHFACGLGFCWGCAIETKNGSLRVCKEGPIFEGDLIAWEKI